MSITSFEYWLVQIDVIGCIYDGGDANWYEYGNLNSNL